MEAVDDGEVPADDDSEGGVSGTILTAAYYCPNARATRMPRVRIVL